MTKLAAILILLFMILVFQNVVFRVTTSESVADMTMLLSVQNSRIDILEARLAHLIAYPHPVPLPPIQSIQRAPTMRPALFEQPCAPPTAPAASLESTDWM